MFTGIVRAVGEVTAREAAGERIAFRVGAPDLDPFPDAGDSVAVDGVCQTVTEAALEEGEFGFEAVAATLARTTLGDLEPGRRVNIEPPLRAGDALGGHFVQGHVDGVGEVLAVERGEGEATLRIRLPEEVARTSVPRGSVAVDGVSLTIQRLEGAVAEIAVIPYTWSHTTLSRLEPGARVNLEGDVVGKYVRKLLRAYGEGPPAGAERAAREPDRS